MAEEVQNEEVSTAAVEKIAKGLQQRGASKMPEVAADVTKKDDVAAAVAQAEAGNADHKAAELATPKYATGEDVERIVKNALNGVTQQAAFAADAQLKRTNFINNKMGIFPDIYRDAMPQSGDEKVLNAALAAMTEKVNGDFDKMLKGHPRYKTIKSQWENLGGGDGGKPPGQEAPAPITGQSDSIATIQQGLMNRRKR